jgi:ATP-dependent exoDNAse (exonuclease V) alpha subunit
MMVLGTAGTGKSWLVNVLSHLLGGRIRRAAPTGMAAFLIGGSTLHTLLKLPLRAGRALSGDSLKRLQQSLYGVDYLVIDELSMVSQSQFAWVDRRLRQATGKTDTIFGGISVIMTGDPGQLPPVCGRALYAGDPKDQLSQEGFSAYRSFRHVIILHKVQQQLAAEDGDQAQKSFLELLPRARDGCLNEDDWRLLLTRAPHLQTEENMESFKNATRLFYSKAEVKRYNGTKLRELGTSVLKVEANHSSASARKASAELAQGLHRDVFLARGARVMLTRNLWSEVGLVNGIRGDVVDILWAHGEKAPALPDFVVLRLEGYTGPVWSIDPRYQGCVPIAPFETSWSTTGDDRGCETRRQLPLALCWSITMHKSQGQTLDKAVVDLGRSEATAGLTFVCLSRAKRLTDLLIEPMTFERLSKLGEKPTLRLRLREEERLRALAGETLHHHGGVA